jgi:hypothetical protein
MGCSDLPGRKVFTGLLCPLSAFGQGRASFGGRVKLPRILITAKQFRGQRMVDRIFIIPARLKSIPSGRVML